MVHAYSVKPYLDAYVRRVVDLKKVAELLDYVWPSVDMIKDLCKDGGTFEVLVF